MNHAWSYNLAPTQRANPVVYQREVQLPENFIYPEIEVLEKIFSGKGPLIKTWGHEVGQKEFDPHWIGTRGRKRLHSDPAYPRYSHHLKIRVDEGIYVWGLSREKLFLRRGLFYILDAHSPHEIGTGPANPDGFNIGIAIDASAPLEVLGVIARLVKFGQSNSFLSK